MLLTVNDSLRNYACHQGIGVPPISMPGPRVCVVLSLFGGGVLLLAAVR